MTHPSTIADSGSMGPPAPARRRPLWPAYACESFSSVGTTLLQVGIFFYTRHYFGWGMRENFLLACGQGAVYVAGSLAAARVVERFGGRRQGLVVIYSVLTIVSLLALAAARSPCMLVVALMAHTLIAAGNWPAVESLVTAGADAHAMSHRVGMYNLVWSSTNALTFAASGSVIEHWRAGLFVVPAIAHALSAALMIACRSVEPTAAEAAAHAHVEPEPELLRKRTLAMWLARISLPATYVVVYSLMAMMPSLPVMRRLDPGAATLVGSAWMAARFGVFIALGVTRWWHTRPSLLLASAAVMLVAFIGVTVRPSDFFPGAGVSYATDLAAMVAWQVLLGCVMGVIYAGSLYFGMVLSSGSTEHGGYHEALIGLGSILGPGTAALAQWRWPDDVRAGVIAVSGVIGLSVAAAVVASVRAARRPTP
ncbi:MAG TPA: MFS transporter [Tepidisphaeraceae bacterium]|nr:MFS transporter [Tepidisphaeraceae bacterium]